MRAEDADEMVDVLDDERLHSFIGGNPASREGLRERYRRLAAGSPAAQEAWLNWIVRRRHDFRPVGTVQASVTEPEATRHAAIAWVIGVPWQNQGFASEAAAALVGWLRNHDAVEVTAHIHPGHSASARVAARAGLEPTKVQVDGEQVWRLSPAGGSREVMSARRQARRRPVPRSMRANQWRYGAPAVSTIAAPRRPWLRSLAWRIVANPRIYDLVQLAVGSRLLDRRLRKIITAAGPGRGDLHVADVGGGTGLARALFPATCWYTLIDNDEQKLAGYRARQRDGTALHGSAERLPLRDLSQDVVLLRYVAHHLTEAELPRAMVEIARVLRDDGVLIFMDPLSSPGLVPRLLWHFDRGAHPRTAATYQRLISRDFDIQSRRHLRGVHRYLVCTARPRRHR